MPATERRDDIPMLTMLTNMNDSVLAMRKELSDHIASEPEDIAQAVKNAVAELTKEAFPNDDAGKVDLAGHKSAHQEMIDTYRKKKEFWGKMLFELTKWGLIGFTLWMLKGVAEHVVHTISAAMHAAK